MSSTGGLFFPRDAITGGTFYPTYTTLPAPVKHSSTSSASLRHTIKSIFAMSQQPNQSSTTSDKGKETEAFLRTSTDTQTTLPAYSPRSEDTQRSYGTFEQASVIEQASTTSTSPKRRSSMASAFDKMKSKLPGRSNNGEMERIADDEAEFQRLKEREQKKEERKAEYERLGLGNKTKFGMGGMNYHNS